MCPLGIISNHYEQNKKVIFAYLITINDFSGQCRGLFPSIRTHSSDTLCSMDSLSDDGHIEIKIPSPIPVTITAPDDEPQKNGDVKNLHHTMGLEVA